jgi:amphi-Trp domain-containing protein
MKRPTPRKSLDLVRTYSRNDFIAKLRRLADALESRKAFSIQVSGERLHIPASAVFNIEHEREGGREELEFQLLWQRPRAAARATRSLNARAPHDP